MNINKFAKDATTKELLENLGHLKITDLDKDQTFKFISVRESLGAKTLSKVAITISIVLPLLLAFLDFILN
jgi:hypothetical protein